jgi:hypothetical protein
MGTKPAEYRELSFSSYTDLAAELDRLERAHQEGRLTHLGNWTPGQIFQHVAKFMRFSFDGFPFKAPWFVAAVGRLMKPFMSKMKLRPGFKLPEGASDLLPDDHVGFEDGVTELRTQMARLTAGEQMNAKSPLFGRLGHERWKQMHLDHAAMHLGFLKPEESESAETAPAGERAPVAS